MLYFYDANPREQGFTNNAQGRLAAVLMNASWWYEYNYSVAGRVQNQRLQIAGQNHDVSYGWDHEGRMSSQSWPSSGPQYQFQYDNMGRVSTMLDTVTGYTQATASYGVANELLGLTFFGFGETQQYNSQLQLIRQTVPGAMDMQYIFPAGQNNGRISSSIDGILGETVNYTYDSLNRLSSASGAWSQSYSYDGFGNLTWKSAAGMYPAYSAAFDPATNRQTNVTYDANGNQTDNKTYDVSNRLVTSTNGQSYAYDYRGKRIVKWTNGSAEMYLYGIDGRKLTTLSCNTSLNFCWNPLHSVYFAGKMVEANGVVVVTDRLGSVRWSATNGGSAYFPYGEERTVTADDRDKFGTYTRDNPGQDYADQRYYGVGTGRFWSPDPSGMRTAEPLNPMTWNRYAYGNSDPVNKFDPTGLNVFDGYSEPGADTVNFDDEFAGGSGDESEEEVADGDADAPGSGHYDDLSTYTDQNGTMTINDPRVTQTTTVSVSATVDQVTYVTMTTAQQLSLYGPYLGPPQFPVIPTSIPTLPTGPVITGPAPPKPPAPPMRVPASSCIFSSGFFNAILPGQSPNTPVGSGNATIPPNPEQTNYGRGNKASGYGNTGLDGLANGGALFIDWFSDMTACLASHTGH